MLGFYIVPVSVESLASCNLDLIMKITIFFGAIACPIIRIPNFYMITYANQRQIIR